jgi:uncharacterized membrane protein
MIPDPLHPAVVHFPIVLAVLLPIFALGSLWAIRVGARPARAWAIPVALAAALVASAWVALETGEAEKERVEAVVEKALLHGHEEAGERFLVLSALVLIVAGVGLFGGTLGSAGRLLASAGSLGVLVVGLAVGKAGGELVYRHGAAQPYVTAASSAAAAAAALARTHDDDDHDR